MIRIADLFCCGGGAAAGLRTALPECEIVGVDFMPQPRYPYTFILGDVRNLPMKLQDFDLIWASPPCQKFSRLNNCRKRDYPDLIPFTRKLLKRTGRPYVIENVPGAPLINPLVLSGNMFNLGVYRTRHFEISGFRVCQPLRKEKNGSVKSGKYVTVCGHGSIRDGSTKKWKRAMGVDWLTLRELTQCVPPAYSRYIGDYYALSRGNG